MECSQTRRSLASPKVMRSNTFNILMKATPLLSVEGAKEAIIRRETLWSLYHRERRTDALAAPLISAKLVIEAVQWNWNETTSAVNNFGFSPKVIASLRFSLSKRTETFSFSEAGHRSDTFGDSSALIFNQEEKTGLHYHRLAESKRSYL